MSLNREQLIAGASFGLGMALASPFMGFLWAVGMHVAQRIAE